MTNQAEKKPRRNAVPQSGSTLDARVLEQMLHSILEQFADAHTAQYRKDATSSKSGRRAVSLKQRMLSNRAIYNAAWFVRFAENGSKEYREEMMRKFWEVCLHEYQHCTDIESLTYAVADSLTLYRNGFPWEG